MTNDIRIYQTHVPVNSKIWRLIPERGETVFFVTDGNNALIREPIPTMGDAYPPGLTFLVEKEPLGRQARDGLIPPGKVVWPVNSKAYGTVVGGRLVIDASKTISREAYERLVSLYDSEAKHYDGQVSAIQAEANARIAQLSKPESLESRLLKESK